MFRPRDSFMWFVICAGGFNRRASLAHLCRPAHGSLLGSLQQRGYQRAIHGLCRLVLGAGRHVEPLVTAQSRVILILRFIFHLLIDHWSDGYSLVKCDFCEQWKVNSKLHETWKAQTVVDFLSFFFLFSSKNKRAESAEWSDSFELTDSEYWLDCSAAQQTHSDVCSLTKLSDK